MTNMFGRIHVDNAQLELAKSQVCDYKICKKLKDKGVVWWETKYYWWIGEARTPVLCTRPEMTVRNSLTFSEYVPALTGNDIINITAGLFKNAVVLDPQGLLKRMVAMIQEPTAHATKKGKSLLWIVDTFQKYEWDELFGKTK